MLNQRNQVFDGIKYHIKNISNNEVNFDDSFDRIKFLGDDNLPLGKLIYFPTLTIVLDVFSKKEIFFIHKFI